MIGVSDVIAFFIGAFVGRYFENIRDMILKIREDLSKIKS